ncbi:MAG: hypothetical protein ACPH2J_05915 [Akkermansiaceae bacterium]
MSKKKDSHLLIPGAEGWELWTGGVDSPFVKSLADGPLHASEIEDIPTGNLVMGFPVREALAVPFKVQTDDQAMFDDLASMHLEKSGIRLEENAGRLTDVFPAGHEDGQTTLLSVVLSAPKTESMPLPAPGAFDISARFFPMVDDAITLWRELGRWVFAIHSHGALVYFQALSGEKLSGDTIRDVYLALTQLGLQGVNLELHKAVVWRSGSASDPTDEEISAFGHQLGAEVSVEAKPQPVLPDPVSGILPADARNERRIHREKKKRNTVLMVVLLLYLAVAGYLGYDYFQVSSALGKQDEKINDLRQEHGHIALFNADWEQLAPVVDSNHWPLQLLYRAAIAIPPSQDLRFKVFEASRDRITIRGESADLNVASTYAQKIRRALQDYDWELPPASADNKTKRWTFNYEGNLRGDPE